MLTGEFPFSYNTVHECTRAIVNGVRPGKPKSAEAIGLSAALWELVQACWGEERAQRPNVHVIVDIVRDAAARWHVYVPPSSPHSGEGRPLSRSDKGPGECIGIIVYCFACSLLNDCLDMISCHDRTEVTPNPHTSQVVVLEPITGELCGSVIRGEALMAHKDSRKGWRILARLVGVAGRRLLGDPKGTPNGHSVLSGENEIRNIHVVMDPVRLWKEVIWTSDEEKAVRALAGILVDKEGRNFISNLLRKDAELCIEILDRVSCAPHQYPSSAVLYAFFRVSQSTTSKQRRNRRSSSR